MIVRYKPKEHYKAVASWYHARGLEAPTPDKLPETGFIVDGIVAGWLYRTDSSVALIDGVISNPATLPGRRRLALKRLAAVLTDLAVATGYPDVIFTSANPAIQQLGVDMGYRPTEQRLYVLDGSEDDAGNGFSEV